MFERIKRLAQRFRRKKQGDGAHAYAMDAHFATTLTEIAHDQKRDRKELYDSVLRAGIEEILRRDRYTAAWETLSPREQEVAALICLGYSSYQIADILTISYDTVRSHSKHIYVKFNLKRKELRHALRDWHFAEWWEENHPS